MPLQQKPTDYMKIFIDADACPNPIKDVLYKAAQRNKIELILVANKALNTPSSIYIKRVQVASGLDVADNYIADAVNSGDLVITADVPLADRVVDKHGYALDPRGELFTKETIKQRLSMRNFMETLRASGLQTSGPSAFNARDKQQFANALNRFLAQQKNIKH